MSTKAKLNVKAPEPTNITDLSVISGSTGTPLKRGTKELLKAYSDLPWLRAIVHRISHAMAAVGWEAFVANSEEDSSKNTLREIKLNKDPKTRSKMIRKGVNNGLLTRVDDHPSIALLDAGNPLHTGIILRQVLQAHMELVGEGFWLIEKDRTGNPVELWPLPPTWIKNTPQPGGPPFFTIESGNGKQRELSIDNIIWFSDLDPSNPYGRGTGTARSLADELDSDEYAAKHIKSWFFNRARPDLLIFADGLQQEETARLEEDWNSKHQGLWKQFKVRFMNAKVEVKELSTSFSEMQLVELRKHERDTIVQVFGVPPEVLGILQNSNRATIDAADFMFSRWVLTPRLEVFRSILQTQLMDRFWPGLVLDYVSPVAEDKEQQLNLIKAAPWAATVDEVRELIGLDRLPNDSGNVHLVPLNFQATTDLKSLTATPVTPELPEEPEEDEENEEELNEDTRAFVDAIEDSPLIRNFKVSLVNCIVSSSKHFSEIFGIDELDFYKDTTCLTFVDRNATKRATAINKVTRDALVQIVSVKEKHLVPKLIKELFEFTLQDRIPRVCLAETLKAINFSLYQQYKLAGFKEKTWYNGNNDKCHESLNNISINIDSHFTSINDNKTLFPGGFRVKEENQDCKCFIIPISTAGNEKIYDRLVTILSSQNSLMATILSKEIRIQQDSILSLIGG